MCTERTPNDRGHYKVKGTSDVSSTQPRVPNFNPFSEKVQGMIPKWLVTNCNMHEVTSKWPWTQWCQRYPLYVVSVSNPRVQNFKRFCRFLVTGNFETSVLNDPKWPWTQQSQGTLCMLHQYQRVSDFNPFRSTTSSLRLPGYVGTSVANDRKMTPKTQVHFYMFYYKYPRGSNFIPLCSTLARVPDNWSF